MINVSLRVKSNSALCNGTKRTRESQSTIIPSSPEEAVCIHSRQVKAS